MYERTMKDYKKLTYIFIIFFLVGGCKTKEKEKESVKNENNIEININFFFIFPPRWQAYYTFVKVVKIMTMS